MSQPPVYNRSFSFTSFQTQNPVDPLPGASLDIELNNIKQTLDALRANIALIQNDDTTLKNQSVGVNQLSSTLTMGFQTPTTWITDQAYTASPASTVFQSSKIYICLVSHTSGVFATDLANGYWQLIFDFTAATVGNAASVAFTPTGTITASNVQTALAQLDTLKSPVGHTHVSADITDSTTAGRALLTAANLAAQQTLLGIGAASSGAMPGFVNLKVLVTTTTALTVAADFVTLVNSLGDRQVLAMPTETISTAASGALGLDTGTIASSSWYYVWAIAEPNGTLSALISLNSTSPTMPSGYTYKARLGSVRTKSGSAVLLGTLQLNKCVQYVRGSLTSPLPLIASGTAGTYNSTTPTYVSASISNFFPPTAATIKILVSTGYNNGSSGNVILAPSTAYSGTFTTSPPLISSAVSSGNGSFGPGIVEFVPEATTVGWASDQSGGALVAFGWTENL